MIRSKILAARWFAVWLACVGQLLAMQLDATAQSTDIGRQVKAAYLYKFIGFIELPKGSFVNAGSPFIIGVMGEDALADDLELIVAGRTVNGRPLSVRRLGRGDFPTGLHMLYTGHLEKNQLLEVYASLKGRPVLTVSDSDEAYALGSMIHFIVTDDKLRFEVALKPAELSQIKFSALLLAAAYKVLRGSS